jgi:beta-glucosidase
MSSTLLVSLLACLLAQSLAQTPSSSADIPPQVELPVFRDPARSPDERTVDLLSRLTLDERISQLLNASAAIDRLGIPAYDWWNECLHGVADAGRATVFPQAIGLGATFDEDLIRRVAAAISDEARAKHNVTVAATHGASPRFSGLTFWAPNINIYRDPRWGRGQETYGEDPFLTGRLGTAFVRGLQGDDLDHLKIAACAKHFAVHSGPEPLRHKFNAVVGPRDLNETYLPAFHALVDAGVAGVMCAYNRTNDEPCCAGNVLLKQYLRDRWGFRGYVVSDCGAVSDFHTGHHVTADAPESAALAVKSGVNIECGHVYADLAKAIAMGLASEHDVDEALAPAMAIRFRLGLFDPPEISPYAKIGPEVINCQKHRDIAREAADKSIVLLKNSNGTLPLKTSLQRIAIVGPNATSIEALMGNYYGLSSHYVTILEGVVARTPPGCTVEYVQGCMLCAPADGAGGAIWAGKDADAVVAVMGINSLLEGEEGEALANGNGGDRTDIGLPANQIDFLRKLRAGLKKPLIVVLTGGGPIACPEVQELADAVLFAWYPGEQGGTAVADVLFGDVNPSGRLPVTFPMSTDQLPAFEDYAMAAGPGRTYRYMRGEPLYPFGFGLSYTTFEYHDLKLSRSTVHAGESVHLQVIVENAGMRAGEEVVQVYVAAPAMSGTPISSLKGFRRVAVEAGKSRIVEFDITSDMLAMANEQGLPTLVSGEYRLTIGAVSPSARGAVLGASAPVVATLRVE